MNRREVHAAPGRILVVGGAGYVGAHMVKQLLAAGASVTTLDNLSTGRREAVSGGAFVHGDLGDAALLDRVLAGAGFDAVMHFAAYAEVGASLADPATYYANNVANTIALLNAMARHGVPCLIYSSSAAIFGEPRYVPIDEYHPQAPINPYGRSKWLVEQLLPDYERAYGLRSVCLRYFNAAGADPDGDLGEDRDTETHLIPLALACAAGRLPALRIFGTDYATADGTCVRDYVHVRDLCDAHRRALRWLRAGGASLSLNLGSGAGYSVRQVVRTVERVTGRRLPTEEAARRPGDPARLVADAALARAVLGWRPRFPDLETIVRHAWRWECRGEASPPARPSSAAIPGAGR